MATVIDAHPAVLTPVSGICGAAVTGSDGEAVGTVAELMVESASGRIVYAAVSVGGVLGIGEALYAVPWQAFQIAPVAGNFALPFTRDEVVATPAIDKDNWPIEANAALLPR